MGIIDTLIRENVLEIYHDFRTQTALDFSGKGRHGVFAAGSNGSFCPYGFISSTSPKLSTTITLASPLSSVSFFALTNGIVKSPGVYPEIASYTDGTPFEWQISALLTDMVFAGKHLAGTYANKLGIGLTHTSGSAIQTYIDGNSVGVMTGGALTRTYGSAVIQIASYAGANYQLACPLKCFVMVSRVLTATEMSVLYSELQEKKFPTRTYSIRQVDSSVNPNEPGLVAAWDFGQVVNTTLADSSGNGKNLTGNGSGVQTPLGLAQKFTASGYMSGAFTTLPNGSDVTIEGVVYLPTISANWPVTIDFNSITGVDNSQFLLVESANSIHFQFYNTVNGYKRYTTPAVTYTAYKDKWLHFALTYIHSTGTTAMYINGAIASDFTLATTVYSAAVSASSTYFGRRTDGATTISQNEAIRYCRVFNRNFSAAEVKKAYEASGLQSIQEVSGFGTPVSTASRGGITGSYLEQTRWQFGSTTPRYTIDVSTINGEPVKVIKCVTAGHIYQAGNSSFTPQQRAYGTWEMTFQKVGLSNSIELFFIDSNTTTTGNGYYVQILANEVVALIKAPAGTVLISSAIAYVANSAWYTVRVTRTFSGAWSLYIKGGVGSAKEYPVWTLVGSAAADASPYTSSPYQVIDIDATDMISIGSQSGNYAMTWKPFM